MKKCTSFGRFSWLIPHEEERKSRVVHVHPPSNSLAKNDHNESIIPIITFEVCKKNGRTLKEWLVPTKPPKYTQS